MALAVFPMRYFTQKKGKLRIACRPTGSHLNHFSSGENQGPSIAAQELSRVGGLDAPENAVTSLTHLNRIQPALHSLLVTGGCSRTMGQATFQCCPVSLQASWGVFKQHLRGHHDQTFSSVLHSCSSQGAWVATEVEIEKQDWKFVLSAPV